MSTEKSVNGWTVVVILLVLVIIAGGIYIGLNYRGGGPVEISLAPTTVPGGEVYIGGEVNNPGFYPLYEDDSITGLIAAAGGITGDADGSEIELIVSGSGNVASAQLVNINTAEAWLLESLPGIGAVKAQAIIEYRRQYGPFRNIQEITSVEGIGLSSFEQIKYLITVAD
jgi:competence protein ComEA